MAATETFRFKAPAVPLISVPAAFIVVPVTWKEETIADKIQQLQKCTWKRILQEVVPTLITALHKRYYGSVMHNDAPVLLEAAPPSLHRLVAYSPPIAFKAQLDLPQLKFWWPGKLDLKGLLIQVAIGFGVRMALTYLTWLIQFAVLLYKRWKDPTPQSLWQLMKTTTNMIVNDLKEGGYINMLRGLPTKASAPFSGLTMAAVLLLTRCCPTWFGGIYAWKTGKFASVDGTLRGKIRTIKVPRTPLKAPRHSHPITAGKRDAADTAINSFILMNGLKPYCIQMSQRDMDAKFDGSLQPIWSRDLHAAPRSDPIQDTHVIKMTNVDYYIKWEEYLWMAKPFILFTFTPSQPAGTEDETSWTINASNEVEMEVRGGSKYKHQLWDYDREMFIAEYPGVSIHYAIEIVPVYTNWSIVWMVPINTTGNQRTRGCSIDLRRKQIVQKVMTLESAPALTDVAIIKHHGDNTATYLAKPGESASLKVSSELWQTLEARVKAGSLKVHDLVPVVSADYKENTRFAQGMVWRTYPLTSLPQIAKHSPVKEMAAALSYAAVPATELMAEEKLTMRVVAAPVIDQGFAPMKSKANDKWTVAERIVAVHNPQETLEAKYQKYATEFAEMLIPEPGVGFPMTLEQIREKQVGAKRKSRADVALPSVAQWLDKGEAKISSFMKTEAYDEPKDPRNISTLPIEQMLLYSTYTHPFAELLKNQDWYIFGRHPNEVARMVTELANKTEYWTETDFSRFDGTHSTAMYQFELMLLKRYFPRSEHECIETVHAAMRHAPASTAYGVKYDLGGSRVTGAADTSIFNTTDNAFVAYCALRNQGLTKVEAWRALGLYGGDDGITPLVKSHTYEVTCNELGLKLKATRKLSSEPTSLLAQIYPFPRSSCMHFTDVLRMSKKLHLSGADKKFNQHTILWNKAISIMATDSQTPILSDWAVGMMAIVRMEKPESCTREEELITWSATLLNDDEKSIHQFGEYDDFVPIVAQQMDMTTVELIAYGKALRAPVLYESKGVDGINLLLDGWKRHSDTTDPWASQWFVGPAKDWMAYFRPANVEDGTETKQVATTARFVRRVGKGFTSMIHVVKDYFTHNVDDASIAGMDPNSWAYRLPTLTRDFVDMALIAQRKAYGTPFGIMIGTKFFAPAADARRPTQSPIVAERVGDVKTADKIGGAGHAPQVQTDSDTGCTSTVASGGQEVKTPVERTARVPAREPTDESMGSAVSGSKEFKFKCPLGCTEDVTSICTPGDPKDLRAFGTGPRVKFDSKKNDRYHVFYDLPKVGKGKAKTLTFLVFTNNLIKQEAKIIKHGLFTGFRVWTNKISFDQKGFPIHKDGGTRLENKQFGYAANPSAGGFGPYMEATSFPNLKAWGISVNPYWMFNSLTVEALVRVAPSTAWVFHDEHGAIKTPSPVPKCLRALITESSPKREKTGVKR